MALNREEPRRHGRTLVTGINGFTGRYVAQALLATGHEVHGITHGAAGVSQIGATLHACDLTDATKLSSLIESIAPTRIVHLAAIAFAAHSDIEEMYRTNIIGTRNLLDSAARVASPIDAILIASSANVYGNGREGTLDETAAISPSNDYGVTKAAAEYLAALYRNRLPIITVRPFNYTGVGQADNFIIPKIINHVRRREPLIELGNIDVARDFLDVRTVIDAYVRLLDCPAAIGETFNICSGRAIELRAILQMIKSISGHDLEVRTNPAFVRANEIRTLCGVNDRIEKVIGPLRIHLLEDTLRWMLEA